MIVLQTGMGLKDKLLEIVLTPGTGFILFELNIVFRLVCWPILPLDGIFNDYQLKKLLGVNKLLVLQE